MQAKVVRVVAAALAAAYLGGCAPLVVGGVAAGAAMSASDRRTTGTQVEDQGIELKISEAISGKIPTDYAHVNVTSYNGKVLLSGEVTKEEYKAQAEQFARGTEKVKSVVDELVVAPPSSYSTRSNDTYLTTKVKTDLATEKGVPSATIKVVTEREVVYLFGLVTKTEGDLAAKVASQVSGVKRVVKLFDYLTPAEVSAREAAGAQEPAKK